MEGNWTYLWLSSPLGPHGGEHTWWNLHLEGCTHKWKKRKRERDTYSGRYTRRGFTPGKEVISTYGRALHTEKGYIWREVHLKGRYPWREVHTGEVTHGGESKTEGICTRKRGTHGGKYTRRRSTNGGVAWHKRREVQMEGTYDENGGTYTWRGVTCKEALGYTQRELGLRIERRIHTEIMIQTTPTLWQLFVSWEHGRVTRFQPNIFTG